MPTALSALSVAVLAGLGGMFGWGLADFFAKKTIDRIGDVASLAWGHVFGTLALLAMTLYPVGIRGQRLSMPEDFQAWAFLILFGVLQATVYFLVYKGFGKGPVGLLSPVFASFSGLTAIVSIVALGEIISGHVLLGLATLFIGILLINVDVQALRIRRLAFTRIPGFREVALAMALATIWTLGWDWFIGGKDWLSYTFFMYAAMTVTILLFSLLRQINVFVVPPSLWKFLALIGICETAAYVAISVGYSTTPLTSVVALLSGAFSLPTIILARMFLRERISAIQTVGSLVIVAGIMLLSVL